MSFEQELSVLSDIVEFAMQEKRKLALAIDTRLILETPVDTSQARYNWAVSVGSPDTDIRKQGSVSKALVDGRLQINNNVFGQVLYIQNNLPYIVALNDGHSAQAPANYIDRIISQEVNRAN